MKKMIQYTLTAVALTMSGSATGQNLSSAYFMDGYVYGHELNPAKEYSRKGYFSVPLLPGNLNVGNKGNLYAKNLFRKNPNGNGLVTYLHPDISAAEALEGFHENNKMMLDARYDLLSIGFHAFKGYNTITLGSRVNAGLNIPYGVFEMTKNLQNKNYDISGLGATATCYTELALGHSRQLNEAWRIGAKAKLLMGIGYAKLKVDNMYLNLETPDRWTATANATLEGGINSLTWGATETKQYKQQYPGHTTYEQIDLGEADVDKFRPNGMGFAIDLGAEWDLEKQGMLRGMKVSAGLLDLGFIRWSHVAMAHNNGTPFVFDGFNDIPVKDGEGTSFDQQADELGDKLSDLLSMQDGGTSGKTRMLGATLNLGAEYRLPVYDKLKFGLLSTTRIQGSYSWNEERIGVTISPVKWFEASANVGVGTMGCSMGWILNICPKGFNLFVGSDHQFSSVSKQGVPLSRNTNISMGINFPLGKSRGN